MESLEESQQNENSLNVVNSQLVDQEADLTGEEADGRKRREILARRPSYRKILNDLSDSTGMTGMSKISEEDNASDDGSDSQEGSQGLYQVIPASAIQIAAHADGSSNQGLQTLTMSNSSTPSQVSTAGATIVQYAQGPDGQFFIPASTVQAYQISPATSLSLAGSAQSVVMTSSGLGGGGGNISEEASRKRELRLLKNREAAKECRRKKKEYVKCLENRVAVLENQNKALIEELKSLKELYCQKDLVPGV